MIVQIVLVILTAVQVNSQLCPSVCQCDSEQATCRDLFSDVTSMKQETFDSALRTLRVTGSTRLELQEDLFQRLNITSLTFLDLSQNNITKMWQRAFYSLHYLQELNLTGNSITSLHSQTFYNNTRLERLSLSKNSINDIQESTFLNSIHLTYLDISEKNITSLHADLFKKSTQLQWVRLANNRITNVHPSTFQNNIWLKHF